MGATGPCGRVHARAHPASAHPLFPPCAAGELRDKRLAELTVKFNQLAAIEEKEFVEAAKAGSGPSVAATKLR